MYSLFFLCCRYPELLKPWQEINLVSKRESLSLNAIGRPKTPLKCNAGSQGNSQNHHPRAGPLRASETNLKHMEPYRIATINVQDGHGHLRPLEKNCRCRKHSFDHRRNHFAKLLGKPTSQKIASTALCRPTSSTN